MRMKHLGLNIYLIYSDILYPVSSAFFRLQEFYESPHKSIRGKFFTHEELMDKIALKDENFEFDYFSQYTGFNVPDRVVKNFYAEFWPNFWRKEAALFDLLNSIRKPNFYVIGAYDEVTLKHEIAHALYYLYPEYRKRMNRLIGKFRYRKQFGACLKKRGYSKYVIRDETQAYLTEERSQLTEYMGYKRKWRYPRAFRSLLDKWITENHIITRIPNHV